MLLHIDTKQEYICRSKYNKFHTFSGEKKISNFIDYKFYLIFYSNENMHFWNRTVVTFLKRKRKEEIAAGNLQLQQEICSFCCSIFMNDFHNKGANSILQALSPFMLLSRCSYMKQV